MYFHGDDDSFKRNYNFRLIAALLISSALFKQVNFA